MTQFKNAMKMELTYTPMGYIISPRKSDSRDVPFATWSVPVVRRKENEMGEKMENTCPHCSSCNKKVRDEKEYKDMMNRLSRIEGQVRGVKGMVENDAYCVDILTQVSAITSALNSFNKVLLANHIKTCVANDIREGKDEKVDELVVTLQKLMK